MGKKIVTSIKIDEDVWKKAKISAIECDLQLSEILEKALDHWVNVEASKIMRGKNK